MRRIFLGIFVGVARLFVGLERITGLGASFFTALAWGVSSRQELVRFIRAVWDEEPVTKRGDFILGGLFPWEEKLYEEYLPVGARIGLIGCGGGRDMIALVRKGHTVDGLDLSPEMVRAAEGYIADAGIEAKTYCADIFEFKFPNEPYDAFIFSNFTYPYIPGRSERLEILKGLRSSLSPQGCIIITCFIRADIRDRRITHLAQWVAKISRNSNIPETGDLFSFSQGFRHVFTHDELTHEIKTAGYDILTVREISRFEFAAVLKPSIDRSSDQ